MICALNRRKQVLVKRIPFLQFSDDGVKRKDYNSQYKFIDRTQIEVKGGRGGNGCISFEIPAPSKKIPTGGNGGVGGNVYVVSDKSLTSFSFETHHFNAEDGKNGGSAGLTGRNGRDVYIRVPCGTTIVEKMRTYYDGSDEDWDFDEEDFAGGDEGKSGWVQAERAPEESSDNPTETAEFSQTTHSNHKHPSGHKPSPDGGADFVPRSIDLDKHDITVLVAAGGKSGVGNYTMKGSALKRQSAVLPGKVIKGELGEQRSLSLELKIIADVGLVGYPNAGKSTLLKAMSNARPKIASYPFTTLHPNIGIVEYSDMERLRVADIPGIIEGASEDRGLGFEFLRHIERTKVLCYVIDASGSESRDPIDDFKCLLKELKAYDEELLHRPSFLFANKLDITPRKLQTNRLRRYAKSHGMELINGSAEDGRGVGELAVALRKMIISS